MYREYREKQALNMSPDEGEGVVMDELRSVMRTTHNNIALVVYQAYFGRLVIWNAAQILSRAREAPVDWLQFVSADDADMFLG